MWTWLSGISPNVAVGLAVALGTFLYHTLLSPSAQSKVDASLTAATNAAFSTAEDVMRVLVAKTGQTSEQLQTALVAEAKIQLAHIGLDTSKLPPAVLSTMNALAAKYLAAFKTANPGK